MLQVIIVEVTEVTIRSILVLVQTVEIFVVLALREKCSYSELLWSVFSRIRAEYGEIICISPYSVQLRENTDKNNSKCGDFFAQCRSCRYHVSDNLSVKNFFRASI